MMEEVKRKRLELYVERYRKCQDRERQIDKQKEREIEEKKRENQTDSKREIKKDRDMYKEK